MNSLTIGFPYVADRFGGSNASSLVLAQALQDAGHRVYVLAHGEGRVVEETQRHGLSLARLPALSPVPGYARPDRFRLDQLRAFWHCRAAILRLRLDIVHTNDLGMLRTWSVPSLATRCALIAHWRTNYRKSRSVEAALHIARAAIAVSQYSFAQLPKWVQSKTTVEYNPFDIRWSSERRRAAREKVRADLGVPQNAALVGVFGNHAARKRTHVLADVLDALQLTKDGRPIIGLACGGKVEPYDHHLDSKIAAFGLETRLLRPGFVRPVEDWIGACDVIIAPAVQEPLSRSILEAQALGVPVVVSTDGGLKELIEHERTGILCDPHDLPQWITATRRILNDENFSNSMTSAAQRVVSRLKPREHACRVAAVYASALGRAPCDRVAA